MDVFEDNLHKEITGERLNSYNVKFYTFVDENKHNCWLKYDIGEIIDPYEFNSTSRLLGEIYFTTFEYIFEYFKFGYFCEIEITNDTRCYIENNKIKSDKIIITKMIHIKDLNDSLLLKCVKKQWNILYYIKQTEEICLEAIKTYGIALKFVEKHLITDEICLEAVKQNGLALEYVEKQTEEICIEAIKQNLFALLYVKNKTEEFCLLAIRQTGESLVLIEEQTEKMCLEAIKQDGLFLDFVEDQTEKICLEAVKQNKDALKYIKNKKTLQTVKDKFEIDYFK
jgi:hypothetical protein